MALGRERLPGVVPLGELLIVCAFALLAQGFVRDLLRLALAPRKPSSRRVTCVCVESVIGMTFVVAGVALSFVWSDAPVHLIAAGWPVLFACIWLFGAGTREIVFDWRTLRFRRDADHGARVVWHV